jgi:hypothetical protein
MGAYGRFLLLKLGDGFHDGAPPSGDSEDETDMPCGLSVRMLLLGIWPMWWPCVLPLQAACGSVLWYTCERRWWSIAADVMYWSMRKMWSRSLFAIPWMFERDDSRPPIRSAIARRTLRTWRYDQGDRGD